MTIIATADQHGGDRTTHKQDKQRARELYKYFQPNDPALLSGGWQQTDITRASPEKLSSPNITLTAYAQYIAIRLNAQRALIRYVPN